MNPQIIAQLLIALAPTLGVKALDVIEELAKVWTKPDLSSQEVLTICKVARTSYDSYVAGK
jgi:hypothetical protein